MKSEQTDTLTRTTCRKHWKEIPYLRHGKDYHKTDKEERLATDVVYIVPVSKQSHGFDGLLGLCHGHPDITPKKTPSLNDGYADFEHYFEAMLAKDPTQDSSKLLANWKMIVALRSQNNVGMPAVVERNDSNGSSSPTVSTITDATGLNTVATPGDSTTMSALAALGNQNMAMAVDQPAEEPETESMPDPGTETQPETQPETQTQETDPAQVHIEEMVEPIACDASEAEETRYAYT